VGSAAATVARSGRVAIPAHSDAQAGPGRAEQRQGSAKLAQKVRVGLQAITPTGWACGDFRAQVADILFELGEFFHI